MGPFIVPFLFYVSSFGVGPALSGPFFWPITKIIRVFCLKYTIKDPRAYAILNN